jgi:hypothetical protein
MFEAGVDTIITDRLTRALAMAAGREAGRPNGGSASG